MQTSKSYELSFNNEEYTLKMDLTESFIEFKLEPKDAISNFYYQEKFDLSTINENKYLIKSFKELNKAFDKFDKLLSDKRVQLVQSREDKINLKIKIPFMDEEEESNLELKQYKITKEDVFPLLLNEVKGLKKEVLEMKKRLDEKDKEILEIKEDLRKEKNKNIELLIEEYFKKKKEEEDKNKQKNEELIRQQEEKRLEHDDNVNGLNDFHCQNIKNMTEINHISNGRFNLNLQTVAVYTIIRNDERLYELACLKYIYDYINEYSTLSSCIVIYNLLSNQITNKIYKAHSNQNINSLKHYYYSPSKKHFLLSSSYKYIKLWNISSKVITKELEIEVNQNNYIQNNSCLLFNN